LNEVDCNGKFAVIYLSDRIYPVMRVVPRTYASLHADGMEDAYFLIC
jgi:hypothetical protein